VHPDATNATTAVAATVRRSNAVRERRFPALKLLIPPPVAPAPISAPARIVNLRIRAVLNTGQKAEIEVAQIA
jgi:hypothetical protein